MSDKDIVEIYTNKTIHNWKEIPQEHIDYLNNRFSDSESIKEFYIILRKDPYVLFVVGI